jgi:hypothetical protein
LAAQNISKEPEFFFPEDEAQERRIAEIAEGYRRLDPAEVRGYRARDDAYRYARPDYIRDLRASKSGATYSYAGFNQLVHVSSGVVRFFLEAASRMYDDTVNRDADEAVEYIPTHLQNDVVRDQANELLLTEFDKIRRDEGDPEVELDKPLKLFNLIQSLGGMFQGILLSDRSERRVFSVALSNRPDKEVAEIFELGVRYGYLHRSSIGNKEGSGRTPLYILSRQLAPVFTLDPTGFAGYKFVTNEAMHLALREPDRFVAQFRRMLSGEAPRPGQSDLFGGTDVEQ